MSEIPEDVISLADQACNQCYDPKTSTWFNVRDIIALAILAEREACAKIAEQAALQSYSPHQHPMKIAASIRRR